MSDIVVMGRNTWEDPMMPRPLPYRINVVVSSRKDILDADKANLITNGKYLKKTLIDLGMNFPLRKIWIIGGAQLLKSTEHLVSHVYLTRFDQSYDCDVTIDIDKYLSRFELTTETISANKRFQVYNAKLPRLT